MIYNIVDFIYEKCEEYLKKADDKDYKHCRERNDKKYFSQIMNIANDIFLYNDCSTENPLGRTLENHPIYNLIRLLGKDVQREYMMHPIKGIHDEMKLKDFLFNLWSKTIKEDIYEKPLMRNVEFSKKISLSKDVVITGPWHPTRFSEALSRYGSELLMTKWKQDSNHQVTLYLPIGISVVEQGNHSITSGILQGEGEISPSETFDMSEYYKYIHTDGSWYYLSKTGKKLSEVRSVEYAAIFEIGRIITDKQNLVGTVAFSNRYMTSIVMHKQRNRFQSFLIVQ